MRQPQTTCANCAGCSADLLPPSPPAEKAKTRQDQAEHIATQRSVITANSGLVPDTAKLTRLTPERQFGSVHAAFVSGQSGGCAPGRHGWHARRQTCGNPALTQP